MARPKKPRVHATGQLFHHFHGTYWCAIVLQFKDAEQARKALPRLQGFEVGKKHAEVLVVSLIGRAIDRTVRRLNKLRVGDKSLEIDGTPFSIDYGPEFEIEVIVDG